ncbi:hypothetical protein PENSTE_c011G07043 [Penicillium steckii]|uniref:Uncharacterized protein n=1 Tax=Penicillium steckii TaxID=303698 RepID=A0A1V6T6K3_9EURO|nr:hypothetical protein PENSTE_c011G07043 [Penicillium steckii]
MISTLGAPRLPLQNAMKGLTSRARVGTPHASIGTLRTLPRHTTHHRVVVGSRSTFSTRTNILEHAQSQRKPDDNYWGSKPFGTPLAMSFESLGIRKNVQLLVMLVLSVGAILEAFLWGEKVWIWYKGEEGDRLD